MKIGNSVVQFNLTCKSTPSGKRCTMDNVPYWKLYARKGDVFYDPNDTLSIVKPVTYEEIVNYLKNTPLHHVYEAYPRFSTVIRGPRERKIVSKN